MLTKQISGFTFIKNGITLGYPVKESIESISDLCDEVIINVGFDDPNLSVDDGTYEYLRDHFTSDKYIFLKSWWDPKMTSRGLILSQQTNIALSKCSGKYCQYIQGDEAIHEDDFESILEGIKNLELRPEVAGLVFNYLHFYGSTDIFKQTRNTYRREVRLIRNNSGIKSWMDAQGFKDQNDNKLKCILNSARVFHYGWARQEQLMDQKNKAFNKLYHGQEHEAAKFEYQRIWGLKPFNNTHPQVMENWIKENHNDLDILNLPMKFEMKNVGLAISDWLEDLTNYRMGEYKNYKLV